MIKTISYKNSKAKVYVENPQEYLQSFWNQGLFYESQPGEILDYIAENYKMGNYIDIGAGIGNHSLFFNQVCQADKVLAFEPNRNNYIRLLKNIILNSLNSKIKIFNFGLSSNLGVKYFDQQDSTNLGIVKTSPNGTQQNYVTYLDSLKPIRALKEIKLIKIDTEDYNIPILKGAIETISTHKPDLYIECGNEKEYQAVKEYLKNLEYQSKQKFNSTPTYLFTYKGY